MVPRRTAALRRMLLIAVGASGSACADRAWSEEAASGTGGGTGADPGTTGPTSGAATTASPSTTTGADDEGVPPTKFDIGDQTRFDVGSMPDVPAPDCADWEPTCDGTMFAGYDLACVPLPQGFTRCEDCEPNCIVHGDPEGWAAMHCNGPCGGRVTDVMCGPATVDIEGFECCYVVSFTDVGCADGRPFVIDGVARVADVEKTGAWSADVRPRGTVMSASTRTALAQAWLADALAEHASVASFARFTLQLLALGAPAELVAGAQRAAADEIRHAQLCFGLAAAYLGSPVGPGALAVEGALTDGTDVESVTRALVVEGCIGETIAAVQVGVASEHASDPAVRMALEQIADDEARHAALAWNTLRWLVDAFGEQARNTARAAFAEGAQAVRMAASPTGPALPEHGQLGPTARRRIALATMGEVIDDCARALLTPAEVGLVLGCARIVDSLPQAILQEARALFHDVRPADIDAERHAAYVIARVLDRGTLSSVRALVTFYGKDRLRAFLTGSQAHRVHPRTVALWRTFLGLPQTECTPRSSFRRSSPFWAG